MLAWDFGHGNCLFGPNLAVLRTIRPNLALPRGEPVRPDTPQSDSEIRATFSGPEVNVQPHKRTDQSRHQT